jgi:signal transduction histidine kinase
VTPKSSVRRQNKSDSTPSSEMDLSRHLLRVQEEERKRISRELHDETGQGLMLLRMYVDSLASESANRAEIRQRFHEALSLLDQTIEGLRRIIARLSPRVLEELGLLAAIRKAASDLTHNSGIRTQLRLPEALGEIDEESAIAIYRTVQEALHNAARHSRAKNVSITLEQSGDYLGLLVRDNGIGFAPEKIGAESFGLLGMRDRIAALGGMLRIRAQKDKGAEVKMVVPVRRGMHDAAPKRIRRRRAA